MIHYLEMEKEKRFKIYYWKMVILQIKYLLIGDIKFKNKIKLKKTTIKEEEDKEIKIIKEEVKINKIKKTFWMFFLILTVSMQSLMKRLSSRLTLKSNSDTDMFLSNLNSINLNLESKNI